MFFELIGTILAGAAAALLVWAINRTFKGRLPSWLIPVAAGVAMLAATISGEYSWFDRTTSNMPAGFIVAETVEESQAYRPWTYIKPYVSRFVAVDQGRARTHPGHPDQRIVNLVIYGRWTRTAMVPILFDCAKGTRSDMIDDVSFGPDGEVLNPDWHTMKPDDPLLQAACATS